MASVTNRILYLKYFMNTFSDKHLVLFYSQMSISFPFLCFQNQFYISLIFLTPASLHLFLLCMLPVKGTILKPIRFPSGLALSLYSHINRAACSTTYTAFPEYIELYLTTKPIRDKAAFRTSGVGAS